MLIPTIRCDSGCPGCRAATYRDVPHVEMELLERIIHECREDLGILFLHDRGGEPFIRPDLLDLYGRHADCYFHVYTNGVLIDEKAVSVAGVKERVWGGGRWQHLHVTADEMGVRPRSSDARGVQEGAAGGVRQTRRGPQTP